MSSGPANYAIKIPSGTSGTKTVDSTYDITGFTPGQLWYKGFYWMATRTTGSNTDQIITKVQWYNSAGAALTPTTNTINVNGSSGWAYYEAVHLAPANAVRGRLQFVFDPGGATSQHDLWVTSIRMAKTQFNSTYGADWDTNLANTPANLAALVGTEAINNQAILDSVANDDVLSVGEKQGQLFQLIADLEARYTDLVARATALSISTTALTTARTNWNNALAALSPAYNDYTQDTPLIANVLPDKDVGAWTLTNATRSVVGGAWQITDSSGTQTGRAARSVSVASGVVTYQFGLLIKKDSETDCRRIEIVGTGGVAKTGGFNFRSDDGTTGGAVNATIGGVLDCGEEWLVYGTFAKNTGNTTLEYRFYPAWESGANIANTSSANGTQAAGTVRAPMLVVGTDGNAMGRYYMTAMLSAYGLKMTALAKAISEEDAKRADVQVVGSGVTVGDGRNLIPVFGAGLRYKFTGAVTYTTTLTSITIDVAAGNLIVGSQSISYNSMSINIGSLVSGSTHTWYLYISSGAYTAGAHTLLATESTTTPFNGDQYVYIGMVGPVTLASSGSGGGEGGGGGLTCVAASAWVETHHGFVRAADVQPGDMLRVLTQDGDGTEWEECEANDPGREPCFLIRGEESGIGVTVSRSTPITLRDGALITVDEIDRHQLPFFADEQLWWEPCFIEPMGERDVRKIKVNQRTYAAGDKQGRMILTHNPKP